MDKLQQRHSQNVLEVSITYLPTLDEPSLGQVKFAGGQGGLVVLVYSPKVGPLPGLRSSHGNA